MSFVLSVIYMYAVQKEGEKTQKKKKKDDLFYQVNQVQKLFVLNYPNTF